MSSERCVKRVAVVAMAILILCFAVHSNAQVTFSRGWEPGKRTVSESHDGLRSVTTALCHLLVNQIRQLSNCEPPNRSDEPDPVASQLFSGGR